MSATSRKRVRDSRQPNVSANEPLDPTSFPAAAAGKSFALGCIGPIIFISALPLLLLPLWLFLPHRGGPGWWIGLVVSIPVELGWVAIWWLIAAWLWGRSSATAERHR